ncbi:MAG: hypothetical protein AVDCRST_MAG56-4405 [uncultured Cytophagales bacterium]|uniref:Uncharacterized protein n=1 Tax=uncultured Cytophagales bacterium TaxID=158755 RepID=A0A6J4JUW0_9SPHI|nr:MAG: hypothetical protein AVDCRST_MAG56-4405 [uncultured Cytophagales bacterium]
MKTNLLLTVALFLSLVCRASDGNFTEAMQAALADLRKSKTAGEMLPVANRFERIAAAEAKEWLPRYWAAYCYNVMSFADKDDDRRDQYLDKAEALVAEAEKLNKGEAEIYILKAYIAQARMAVSPATRWMGQGPVIDENLAKAEEMNARNPRIDYLRGQNLYYKPSLFGGGKEAAKPLLKRALDKYAGFTPASAIHPNWGRERCQAAYDKCLQ